MAKIAVIYYSTYGHVKTMAESIKKGVEESGATCDIYQVAETLPDEVLKMMHAPPKADYPLITPDIMTEYDGFLFGISGRFGSIPAQMKAFLDSLGGLWQKGALVGKSAGTFVSTNCQAAGQENSQISMLSFFAHNGMIFVPIGYIDPALMNNDEIHGGSAWGAGCLAGVDGSRQPSDLEKGVAVTQGKHFGGITGKLAAP